MADKTFYNGIYPFKNNIIPSSPSIQDKLNVVQNGPVKEFSISPSVETCGMMNGKYAFIFDNNCFTGKVQSDGTKYDLSLLKEKLLTWVKPGDRKYIKLASFSQKRSRFEFDIEKWFDDSMTGIKGTSSFAKFSKSYMMKEKLPYMVAVFGQRIYMEKYVASSFKDYCRKHPKLRKTVFSIITDNIEKSLRLNAVDFFDYTYDTVLNKVEVQLKPVYVSMVMGSVLLLLQQKDKSYNMGFNNSARTYLNAFNFWGKKH